MYSIIALNETTVVYAVGRKQRHCQVLWFGEFICHAYSHLTHNVVGTSYSSNTYNKLVIRSEQIRPFGRTLIAFNRRPEALISCEFHDPYTSHTSQSIFYILYCEILVAMFVLLDFGNLSSTSMRLILAC